MLAQIYKSHLAAAFLIAVIIVVDAQSQSSCTTLRQRTGVCVPILSCITITQLLEVSPKPLPPSVVAIVRGSHCGTFSNVVHVCCDTNRVNASYAVTTTAKPEVIPRMGSSVRERPSVESSDADIQTGMSILELTNCGQSDFDRVANGVDSNLSEFPWMALLVYYDGFSRTLDCGGSLITDRYVLTAAHCIRTGLNKKLVSVRLGEHDTQETIDCMGYGRKRRCAPPFQEIDVEEATYHKDYNRNNITNDIGLIRLISQAVFKSSVQPICLPITESSKAERLLRMIIAGWGRIENGLKASVLQKAVVPIKTNDYCQEIHKIINITESQLCAGAENEVDTCKGDSGGPIFFNARYSAGVRWVQYGIVSAGSVQCGSIYPGIYVRVTSYLPWIYGNIKP